MIDVPKGYQRRDDGILEPINGYFGRRDAPSEAVLTWWAGERRFGCIAQVHQGRVGFGSCSNNAKHDPDANGNPTKCGTHCESAVKRREEKQRDRDRREKAKRERRHALWVLSQDAPKIIQQIADGHNDPRTLCLDWLERKAEAEGREK